MGLKLPETFEILEKWNLGQPLTMDKLNIRLTNNSFEPTRVQLPFPAAAQFGPLTA